MHKSTVCTINSWISNLLADLQDETWDIEGSEVIVYPPTASEIDDAFDEIQSESVKEDARRAEVARVKAIPAFRLLQLGGRE